MKRSHCEIKTTLADLFNCFVILLTVLAQIKATQQSEADLGAIKEANWKIVKKDEPQPEFLSTLAERIDDGAHKLYLSTDNSPLELLVESSDDLTQVDVCIEFQLYMGPETSLEFVVEDKLLELVQRGPNDLDAGDWQRFKRCISEYMPHLKIAGSNHHSARIALIAHAASQDNNHVAVLIEHNTVVSLRVLHPTQDYLPDVKRLANFEDFDRLWVIDRDVVQNSTTLEFLEPPTTGLKKRVLQIHNIDTKQEHFDLTSRWLQVRDLEILENPLVFIYEAVHHPWIKSIDFEYQSSNQSNLNRWITQTVYVAAELNSSPPPPPPPASNQTSGPTQASEGTLALGESSSSSVPANDAPPPSAAIQTSPADGGNSVAPESEQQIHASQFSIPIKLKNLDSEEFRIRVRHRLTDRARLADSVELSITTLAFGDACADGTYCLNGGYCAPISVARAECRCLTGYSGDHCQIVRPCEVIYGNLTGKELCESIGARCVENLEVLRCRWPEDPLYDLSHGGTSSGLNGTGLFLTRDDIVALKERSDKQSRLIIVMGVFMIALLLFAVVIVANMISRLLRSKRRLKMAQIEVHELSRRSEPSTSGAAFGRLTGRHKPPAAISYNNQSFDEY